MNKHQVEGTGKEIAGSVKETVGKVTGNKATELKGASEKLAGKAQTTYGDVKDDLKKQP
jgi:uncharacterized protein YjbJ (UPF0337 family)